MKRPSSGLLMALAAMSLVAPPLPPDMRPPSKVKREERMDKEHRHNRKKNKSRKKGGKHR